MRIARRLESLAVVVAAAMIPAACSNTRATEAQLESVAKDWCRTIRASQVLCTYPLTEDLQVGDLYVVSTSIEDQVQQYEDRGFLPFDLLLWRLQPRGYDDMYRGFYGTRGFEDVIPRQWQFPAGAAAGTTDWTSAPAAAFPAYEFSVERGRGLNLAVPVHSVAVGLAIMNTSTATGSISIDDASTYGVPLGVLEQQTEEWAQSAANRAMLARYAPAPDPATGTERQYFLRVIARVYVAGKVNVSLQNGEATRGDVTAGSAAPATVATDAQAPPTTATTAPATTSTAPATDTAAPATPSATPPAASSASLAGTTIAKSTPGGTIRITAVSSRAVSMSETFGRPLVIGYIAFDRPIGPGGVLGKSASTLQRVERR